MNHPNPPAKTPDQIWEGDLFGRRGDAELLIDYIESVGSRPSLREDCRGYTISVDADYGIGKSYFLRRLAEHLELTHPVAFVDAWSDDLANEPLTAITATLKKAIAPLVRKEPKLEQQWKAVASKTGEVAKIVAKGLLKKGLGLVITSAAVDLADAALGDLPEAKDAALDDALKDAGKGAADDAVDAVSKRKAGELMAERIATFEAGQLAITELKKSLSDLVEALPVGDIATPVVVIIDELDRCRPTYAIKLLEETKHLFDVTGIVFVLGMHSEQLSRSVSGAYGPDFDGQGYLRRFVNRQYSLRFPDLEPLVRHLLNQHAISESRLIFPAVAKTDRTLEILPASEMIARYMRAYGMTARDAFSIMDIIQTCVAVTKDSELLMPYLLPMIIRKVKGMKFGQTPKIETAPSWNYAFEDWNNQTLSTVSMESAFLDLSGKVGLSQRDLVNSANANDKISLVLLKIQQNIDINSNALALPRNYEDLLQRVARFSNGSE
ncbi:P-loop NTPase fold protein [Brevundimonas sp.]|uniref:KAP family P-loop NTPase fold protein n=1 Tax=Brevundimonas sp. TaxID=1871086 RepID=UPI00262CC4D8|nr:P-loop NTPase fold protein [Brevundimonas sp.]